MSEQHWSEYVFYIISFFGDWINELFTDLCWKPIFSDFRRSYSRIDGNKDKTYEEICAWTIWIVFGSVRFGMVKSIIYTRGAKLYILQNSHTVPQRQWSKYLSERSSLKGNVIPTPFTSSSNLEEVLIRNFLFMFSRQLDVLTSINLNARLFNTGKNRKILFIEVGWEI